MKTNALFLRMGTFFRSSRFRITFWYAALFLMLELLIGLIIYMYLYNSLNSRLDNALITQARNIRTNLVAAAQNFETFKPDSIFRAPDELVWENIYDAVRLSSRNTFIQISHNKRIIYRSQNLLNVNVHLKTERRDSMTIINFTDPRLSVHQLHAAVAEFGKFDLIVAFPVENITATLDYLINVYYYLFPFFFFVAFMGGALISDKALSRFDKIIHLTDEITAHNLDRNIEGEHYSDEYGRLVKTLNRMLSRIRGSFEYLNKFSISASHELRTPLTILRGELEIALKSKLSEAELVAILQSNYEETLRLIHVVENIFYISRLDRSLIQFQIHPEPLNDFLRKIVQSCRVLGKEREMSITTKLDADVTLEMDSNQMKQVLYNLIDNAIKYGYPGTEIQLATSADLKNNRVQIEVINQGDRINAEEIEKIFEPFYRSQGVRTNSVQGVGLGLSVVKSVIEKHHGTIEVRMQDNNTTSFALLLPLKQKT